MRCLLDTCTFLWWSLSPELLSDRVLRVIRDQSNEVFLSSASCWEIVIKHALNRLEIPAPPDRFILDEIQENAFSVLAITPTHVFELLNLPDIHSDPFDRILVAQSRFEGLQLLTNDRTIIRYRVDTLW